MMDGALSERFLTQPWIWHEEPLRPGTSGFGSIPPPEQPVPFARQQHAVTTVEQR